MQMQMQEQEQKQVLRLAALAQDDSRLLVAQDDTSKKGDGTMREKQQTFERRKLDMEMRFFRMTAKEKKPTMNLLCTVRKVMGVPMKVMAREMGVNRSVIFRMEQGEVRGSISMNNLVRVAGALGCQLIYGIIPSDGGTLEHMAHKRLWKKLLKEERGEG